jgi:hypothetical protein
VTLTKFGKSIVSLVFRLSNPLQSSTATMDDSSTTPVCDRNSSVPLRRLFAWNNKRGGGGDNNGNHPSTPRFGPNAETPKKSNTSRQNDVMIGTQISIKIMTENTDPLAAAAIPSPPRRSPSQQEREAARLLERRRRSWKNGLVLARNKKILADHPPSNGFHHHPVTKKGGMLCFVRYQGLPRHVRYPVGDGTWPAGWCQREIAWMYHGTQLSVDVMWFTPILKKSLSDIQQVCQFALLLRLYSGDEEQAYQHLVSLFERPVLPRVVH